ncbi:MAG: MoxR-like ATPase, partial [Cellvibrionaceae bacterium]
TQSALLEAMSENQVTVDGVTRHLDQHFFVVATQNSQHQTGTFPLPESQLDRFTMRLSLGYPDPESERALLSGFDTKNLLLTLPTAVKSQQLKLLQLNVSEIAVSEQLLSYLQRLLAFTRESGAFDCGLSPRAGMAWLHCAKAWALIHRRKHVLPDDLRQLMLPIVGHRLLPQAQESTARSAVEKILAAVPVVQ